MASHKNGTNWIHTSDIISIYCYVELITILEYLNTLSLPSMVYIYVSTTCSCYRSFLCNIQIYFENDTKVVRIQRTASVVKVKQNC